MEESDFNIKRTKKIKKITQKRLKNIALFYLKRFDSSVANLRSVLVRKINEYAYHNSEFDKNEAFTWVDEIIEDFKKYGYLDDARYCEMKIKKLLAAGKSYKFIAQKMMAKGIDISLVDDLFETLDYNPFEAALMLAKKKKIGPFRNVEKRKEMRKKDMSALIRAGFDYDIICKIMNYSDDC